MAFNNTQKNKTAFSKSVFKQGDRDNAPVVKSQPSLAPLNILKNSVTDASSSKLQKANKLPGRVTVNGAPVELS